MKPSFQSSDLTVAAPKEIYNWRVYILAIVSSMGAFLFGYDLAFIGTSITLDPFIRYQTLVAIYLSDIKANTVIGTSTLRAPLSKDQMHSQQILSHCSKQDVFLALS
jgi:putative Mn2+ efflux pump MntP